MKNKTKSIVLNSSLAIFLLLFFGFLSTVVVFRAPPEYMDRNNKKRFNIEMPATPMETSGDTAVLPLKYITFSLGLKGYLWCASAFLLIFLTIRNLIKLIFRKDMHHWELDALLALSIISLNIVLLSQTLTYSSLEQYEAVPYYYLNAIQTSLKTMNVITSFVSCLALCIYFIGKQKIDFNKGVSANLDTADAGSK